MDPDPEEFFDRIREEIVLKMRHSSSPSKRFMTLDCQKNMWKGNQNLIQLSQILRLNTDELNIVEKELLHTVTILVKIGWRDWSRFKHIFFDHHDENGHRVRTDQKICDYNFNALVSQSFLQKREKAQSFLDNRYCFQPLVIEEGKVIIKEEEGWRLPFVNEKKDVVGWGSYGEVTKEIIAVRQFRSCQNLENPVNTLPPKTLMLD